MLQEEAFPRARPRGPCFLQMNIYIRVHDVSIDLTLFNMKYINCSIKASATSLVSLITVEESAAGFSVTKGHITRKTGIDSH